MVEGGEKLQEYEQYVRRGVPSVPAGPHASGITQIERGALSWDLEFIYALLQVSATCVISQQTEGLICLAWNLGSIVMYGGQVAGRFACSARFSRTSASA